MPRKDKVLKTIEDTLDAHKAKDIVTIDVREKNPFVDYYVIASATNIRQLKALAEVTMDELAKIKFDINHVEGKAESGWILIDAHHVIVNIFSEEERERISLEEILSKK